MLGRALFELCQINKIIIRIANQRTARAIRKICLLTKRAQFLHRQRARRYFLMNDFVKQLLRYLRRSHFNAPLKSKLLTELN